MNDHARLPATETARSDGPDLDTAAPAAVVDRLLRDQAEGLRAARRVGPAVARLATAAADALAAGGRLLLIGAGTSGRLCALEAAECPPTFGSPPRQVKAILAGGRRALARAVEGAEDDRSAGAAAMAAEKVGPRDVVVGVAASGSTPFVAGALAAARKAGARTALVSCNRAEHSKAARHADIVIAAATGAEVLAGSTRLKAGTAQKAILNAVTTTAFARLGRVHGNLMVGVQATNDKLRRRARRIVARIAEVDEARAASALRRAGWDVRIAALIAARGLEPAAARRLLRRAGGRLRPALRERRP